MRPIFQTRTLILFAGDIIVFSAAVWISLSLRAFSLPDPDVVWRYVEACGFLFTIWLLVFVIAGLYEKRVLLYRRIQAPRLAMALGANAIIAALVFFLVPDFGIAPKTILAINLIVTLLLSSAWRLWCFPRFFGIPTQRALIFGCTSELTELREAMSASGLFELEQFGTDFLEARRCVSTEISRRLAQCPPDLVIVDTDHPAVTPALPDFYAPLSKGVSFVEAVEAYEDVFGRVPLNLISDGWVIHNLSHHEVYDGLKRVIDIAFSAAGLCCTAPLFPLLALAIRLDSPGPIFIAQDRVGQYDRHIRLYKFRSMERNNTSLSSDSGSNRVTRVGAVLRKSRLDELPQLFNVLRGDLSLIGPRPELTAGVALYERKVPYYRIRHLIKPGLSGWAQLYHDNHPHHAADIEATKEKLSYDLYYLKHRSVILDLLVGLKTIRKLVAQSGK